MTYPSPAFDINGNLVTVDLEGGDYSNLPEGYYTTPGQAAVARHVEQNTGTPATAQDVYRLYSDTNPATQQAIQQIFDSPPPESDYVAPEPPAAQGWVAPVATPPPTAEDLIAQMYRDSGYTPPAAPVLTQIATGQIDPPITAPLPVTPLISSPPPATVSPATPPSAPNISVDQRLPDTTTAGIPPAPMIGIFDDTAAFVVGSSNGKNVLQLVDADGNLVQWIDGDASTIRYVTTAPAINEKRLIGADADGNPVFQLTDSAQNLVQWTENKTQTGYVVAPLYIRVGPDGKVTPPAVTGGGLPQSTGGGTPAASGGGTPPGTLSSLAKPTIQVGTTPAGLPVMQLADAVGVVEQWIVSNGAITDLKTVPTYGVLFHTAATDAPVQNSGNGVPTGGGSPGQSPERPQIQVGTTSAGWAIFQVRDTAGVTEQWIIDPGPPARIVDLVTVPTYGVLFHDSVTDAAVQSHGGGVVTATPPTSGTTKLFLVGAALLAAYLLNQ